VVHTVASCMTRRWLMMQLEQVIVKGHTAVQEENTFTCGGRMIWKQANQMEARQLRRENKQSKASSTNENQLMGGQR